MPGLDKSFMVLPPLAQGVKLVKDKYQSEKLQSEKLQNEMFRSEKLGSRPTENFNKVEILKPTFRDKLVHNNTRNLAPVVGSGLRRELFRKICAFI